MLWDVVGHLHVSGVNDLTLHQTQSGSWQLPGAGQLVKSASYC